MNETNYAAMSDQELKQYFLNHRYDEAAFQAYLERSSRQPRAMITKVGDADFDIKITRSD